MEAVLRAVADESRRMMLETLTSGPATAGELAALLPIARPGVSRHLRVLREAGLVDVRQEAQRRVYSLRPEPLAEVDEWLGRYRALWDSGWTPCTPRWPGANANEGAPDDQQRTLRAAASWAACDQRMARASCGCEDRFDTDIDDLWSALTDPPRLARWIGEVEGDLRLGGEFRAAFSPADGKAPGGWKRASPRGGCWC